MKGAEAIGWLAVIPVVLVALIVIGFGIACLCTVAYLFLTSALAVF